MLNVERRITIQYESSEVKVFLPFLLFRDRIYEPEKHRERDKLSRSRIFERANANGFLKRLRDFEKSVQNDFHVFKTPAVFRRVSYWSYCVFDRLSSLSQMKHFYVRLLTQHFILLFHLFRRFATTTTRPIVFFFSYIFLSFQLHFTL